MGLLAEEASITINGLPLTPAQSMVVRVAIENMGLYVESSPSIDNELGEDLAEGYRQRIREIQRFLYAGRPRR
ncbi:hypothetical protein [Burkholderia cenocepacia]|uniref:hypothetical protein n=1 Tax=Burkholderia cenocepacia TaxID=95486 RepID=UPI001B98C342|nr:hypothetical protein [Burkholderia cenocepacia]MBR8475824.1 hypothetical protein [Burkholderia cenocepacia]